MTVTAPEPVPVPASVRGRFIVLEGGEGTGKSTQAALLVARIRAAGVPVTAVREPGGTIVGDRVRGLLLDPAHAGLDARAELLLYEASRAELVAAVIRPRLQAGDYVVCDRFTDSTLAYQGYGRGLDLDGIEALNEWATDGLRPELTVLLDLDPLVGVRRATGQGADRLEAEGAEFHARVRAGFLALASGAAHVVVSASASIDEVAAAVWAAVREGDAALVSAPERA